mgnify:FL=1
MQARLMFPETQYDGRALENIAIFAARRCRTTKSYVDLRQEVVDYSDERRNNFLTKVVNTDWALDLLEFCPLIYDLEGVPYWLVMELLRHRLIAREFSIEQLSQRAISPTRLEISLTPTAPEIEDAARGYIEQLTNIISQNRLSPEVLRGAYPQGVLVNLVIAANARAFHHFFYMRCSVVAGGKGGAHPEFMQLADQMLAQARSRYPIIFQRILAS